MADNIKVSNQFINARYNYTELEIEIMMRVIASLNTFTPKVRMVQIKFNDILTPEHRHAGLQYVKTACIALMSKPFEIYTGSHYVILNFASKVEVDDVNREFYVFIDQEILNILMELKSQFTIINLKYILSLNGKHAKRLYMLACQFIKSGNRTLQVDELQKMLGTSYSTFKDFKERVLINSLEEINRKTDLWVENIYQKIGNRISTLQWSIIQKDTSMTAPHNVNYDY